MTNLNLTDTTDTVTNTVDELADYAGSGVDFDKEQALQLITSQIDDSGSMTVAKQTLRESLDLRQAELDEFINYLSGVKYLTVEESDLTVTIRQVSVSEMSDELPEDRKLAIECLYRGVMDKGNDKLRLIISVYPESLSYSFVPLGYVEQFLANGCVELYSTQEYMVVRKLNSNGG